MSGKCVRAPLAVAEVLLMRPICLRCPGLPALTWMPHGWVWSEPGTAVPGCPGTQLVTLHPGKTGVKAWFSVQGDKAFESHLEEGHMEELSL